MDKESIVRSFYRAFSELDAEKMASHYAEDVVFEDPAFGQLKGKHAGNMWKMLATSQRGKDFKVRLNWVKEVKDGAEAEWEADYVFSKTGRKIHNVINARFKIKNNLIVEHRDSFRLHKWASQALGISGILIGWSSFFKKKLQGQTQKLLEKFEKTQN